MVGVGDEEELDAVSSKFGSQNLYFILGGLEYEVLATKSWQESETRHNRNKPMPGAYRGGILHPK
jgi:hypothetical protein